MMITNQKSTTPFRLQIDAIRSVENDIEKVESIILEKKALLKNSKDVH
jgi:hypothetical protein